MQKIKPIRSEKHRRFIASLPCVISGRSDVQAAHIRRGNVCGTGLKPGDNCCVPLSIEEHAKQHVIGELRYWYPYGGYEKATVLAKSLYAVSGDREKALELIAGFKCTR
jgi:hypothetical protein